MENTTLAEVMTAAKQFSSDEKWQLRSMLDEDLGLQNGFKSIEQLMREQGTRPLKFEEMIGSFWPEDEDIDDFVNSTRELRRQSGARS